MQLLKAKGTPSSRYGADWSKFWYQEKKFAEMEQFIVNNQ